MTEMKITLITAEEAMAFGAKEELVLLEQNPRHYPAFHTFLTKEVDDAGGDFFFQGLALHILHGDVGLVFMLVDFVYGDDMGVVERGGGLGLPLKPLHCILIFGEFFG